ncbi:MAG: hypothetical protein KJO35_05045 [Gammaproteobacteria bacterium]|nr:hypothetical protein [Gammaproteobacteria bacterium]
MTLMLNNSGEDVTVAPEAEDAAESKFSALRQILIIALVGMYLFAVLWLYSQFPFIALGGCIAAVVIMLLATMRRWLSDKEPLDSAPE